MATLEFHVQDPGGALSVRRLEAADVPSAIGQLTAAGLKPLDYQEVPPVPSRRRRVPEAQLTTFYRGLATSLAEGVPLVDAVSLIARESHHSALQVSMADVAQRVNEGLSLDRALTAWPAAFPAADVVIVRSGRAGGTLPEALLLLADHRETTGEMSRRVASALVYPAVLAVAVGLMLAVFFSFMMPRFLSLFEELGMGRDKLPLLTLMVVWIGGHLFRLLLWLAVPIAAFAALVRLLVRSATGRLRWDYLKLRVPVVGALLYHAAVSRAAGLLGVLLARRVPLVEALRLAADSAGNAVLGRAFRAAAERVSGGDRLSVALGDTERVPEALVWRLAVAEQAGDLAGSFRAASATHRAQADVLLRAFVAIIEPVLIIGVGLLVGAVIIGCISPLIAIVSQLSGS